MTQTARMGDQGGGTNQGPGGGVFSLSHPITSVGVAASDVPEGLVLTFQDGTTASVGTVGASVANVGFDGHILSSIHINGVSSFYGSADCLVLGFRYQQSASANMDALRLLYVGSPSQMTLAQLEQRCVNQPVDPVLLAQTAAAQDWGRQRAAFWRSIATPMAGRLLH